MTLSTRADCLERQGLLHLLAIKDSDIRILTPEQGRDAADRGIHIGGAFSTVIPLVSLESYHLSARPNLRSSSFKSWTGRSPRGVKFPRFAIWLTGSDAHGNELPLYTMTPQSLRFSRRLSCARSL